MYYVKCAHCTVGVVETKKEVVHMGFTQNTPVNTLNGLPVCDTCIKSRTDNAGVPFPPYDKKGLLA